MVHRRPLPPLKTSQQRETPCQCNSARQMPYTHPPLVEVDCILSLAVVCFKKSNNNRPRGRSEPLPRPVFVVLKQILQVRTRRAALGRRVQSERAVHRRVAQSRSSRGLVHTATSVTVTLVLRRTVTASWARSPGARPAAAGHSSGGFTTRLEGRAVGDAVNAETVA